MNIVDIYPEKSKILLVGPYPPPYGGVSVHIKRLKNLLEKTGCNTNTFYQSKKYNFVLINSIRLFKKLIYEDYSIVHIHGYFRAYALIILLAKCLKGFDIYYTIHNSRLLKNKNGLTIFLILKFLKKIDYLIVVAGGLIEDLKKNKALLPKKVLICNAFLPPAEKDEQEIYYTYSTKIHEFISRRKPLIIANASRISFYNKVDLYGLDICIALSAKLKKRYPKVGLLFSLADEKINIDYIDKMRERIQELNLTENFFIMAGQKELWPLYKKADLAIRPTVTDGDAVSIREALYFKTKVVASDVVPRPNGTIIFKSRNLEDLYHKVLSALESSKKTSDY